MTVYKVEIMTVFDGGTPPVVDGHGTTPFGNNGGIPLFSDWRISPVHAAFRRFPPRKINYFLKSLDIFNEKIENRASWRQIWSTSTIKYRLIVYIKFDLKRKNMGKIYAELRYFIFFFYRNWVLGFQKSAFNVEKYFFMKYVQ